MKAGGAKAVGEPGSLALVEEAVHLLRRLPAADWLVWAAGALPWTVGVLWAWAYASWFAPAGAERAWLALGLVGLWVGLKTAQAGFCARLLARRAGRAPERLGAAAVAGAQLRRQAVGVVGLPAAALAVLPWGWACAYFNNLSVTGAAAGGRAEAWRRAQEWPGQNHLGLLWIGGAALAVWANAVGVVYLVPWLAKTLLGVDNLFATRGVTLLNSTVLAIATMLAWLVLDPLVKAFYTLRVFYGRARRTGEDLRGELAVETETRRSPVGGARLIMGAMVVALLAGTGAEGRAESAPAPAGPVEMEAALDEVLSRRDFRWSLPPAPRGETAARPAEGPVPGFVRVAVETLVEMGRAARRALDRFGRWMEDLLGPRDRVSVTPGGGATGGGVPGWVKGVLYALLGIAALALAWVVVLAWRQGRRPAVLTGGRPGGAAAPDLRDERVHAAQLPTDGWLALAEKQLAAGEWRLAWRALYLAQLARLAEDGLVTLARAKTNLDYERELERRAPARSELNAAFRGRRRAFESVWYGRDTGNAEDARAWFEELRQREAVPA